MIQIKVIQSKSLFFLRDFKLKTNKPSQTMEGTIFGKPVTSSEPYKPGTIGYEHRGAADNYHEFYQLSHKTSILAVAITWVL